MSATHNQRWMYAFERLKSRPGLLQDAIICAVVILLGLTAGGYILTQQRVHWPWEGETHFYATFEDTPAMNPENAPEVRIAGVPVGDVSSATIDDEGHALIGIAIDSQYKVFDNARVVLRPKSPLNESYVELSPGQPPGKPLPEGGVLPIGNSARPIQVDEVLGHLDGNTRYALTSLLAESDAALAHAPDRLPGGLAATDQLLKDLRPVSEAMKTRRDTLQRIITSLSQISTAIGSNDQRLSSLAASLHTTSDTLDQRDSAVDGALAQLPGFAEQLKLATQSAGELTTQLDPTLDNLKKASGSFPDSLARFNDTIDELGDTVDAAKPVADKAKPVISGLRPFVRDLRGAMPHINNLTDQLPPITEAMLPYLDDLGAFVYNTRSESSLRDGTGGLHRAVAQLSAESVSGLAPMLPALKAAASR
jgi:phospholipid/cholesterol/gamma-HCH transport system substrate-binding protein